MVVVVSKALHAARVAVFSDLYRRLGVSGRRNLKETSLLKSEFKFKSESRFLLQK